MGVALGADVADGSGKAVAVSGSEVCDGVSEGIGVTVDVAVGMAGVTV
jgi:hypothetical protein